MYIVYIYGIYIYKAVSSVTSINEKRQIKHLSEQKLFIKKVNLIILLANV